MIMTMTISIIEVQDGALLCGDRPRRPEELIADD
jgi:hypothetical protein